MSNTLQARANLLIRLRGAIEQLETEAALLQLAPVEERAWYGLLTRKLIPQSGDDAFLLVAVVGGTNIGKSVLFNHLAGEKISGATPLASGTKHPVCIVPNGFTDTHELSDVFPGFECRASESTEEALQESDQDLLFWRECDSLPGNLVLLDTPDIDSDAPVNWDRAEKIRLAADVLVVVLTQQKYNDAAVKRFLRRVGDEHREVILVFNQLHLPEDDAYWPTWTETVCGNTGIEPEFIYLAPHDRQAADENRLTFQECRWPQTGDQPAEGSATSIAESLSRLHFETVRTRTLDGALEKLLDPRAGVPGYLKEVRERSSRFHAAAEQLCDRSMIRLNDWPTLPSGLLVSEVRQWWGEQHEGWAKSVNVVYGAIGKGITWPLKSLRAQMGHAPTPPIDSYRQSEWTAIVSGIENLFEKLRWMAENGGDLIGEPMKEIVKQTDRAAFLERLRTAHQQTDPLAELDELIDREMQKLAEEAPGTFRWIRRINTASVAMRPVLSMGLFFGFGGADIVASAVTGAAAQTMVHVAADVAAGTTASVAGEHALSATASQGVGRLQAALQQLQKQFAASRVQWVADQINRELFGELPERLNAAAQLPQSEPFVEIERCLEELTQSMSVTATTEENADASAG
ncbi:GTPase [Calycomorphotria hydatis]|uniref:GTPase Era n=1 Tax=Calycomorphotria hydatis TaxID=2528027 RepID=A0A517T4M7_9PLAN|nr:GTPase [Calycomorphotria hydatis]QDT63332.1 GTPase Era [Calycomorphotria hydatis]